MYKDKDRILCFLESKGVVSQIQFGFRSKHSTEHALIKFMGYATDKLEKGNFVVGVYLDIETRSTVLIFKFCSRN